MTTPTDEHDPAPSPFQHPQWMVGVVLIFAVVAIVAGMRDPIWFLIGSPCIIVLLVYVWVRLVVRRRREHYDPTDRQA
jgi:hypothetical protein